MERLQIHLCEMVSRGPTQRAQRRGALVRIQHQRESAGAGIVDWLALVDWSEGWELGVRGCGNRRERRGSCEEEEEGKWENTGWA